MKYYEKAFKKFSEDERKKLDDYQKDKIIKSYIIKKICKWVFIFILLIFILILLFNSFTSIPTGYIGVKTKFGKIQNDSLDEGLNTKLPFIEKIIQIDCRTKKIEVTSESSTKDLQIVNVSIAVNYNVEKTLAHKLYKEVGTDYEAIIINPAIMESVKSIMAQYTAEELITKRAEVSAMIHESLFNKISSRGFNITEFNIINIDFSAAFNQAIESKIVKQQEVISAQAELEKQKIQNEREISIAEKDAKVMELQNNQITENTLKLKELEIKEKFINKWNGQFPTTMLGEGTDVLFNSGN